MRTFFLISLLAFLGISNLYTQEAPVDIPKQAQELTFLLRENSEVERSKVDPYSNMDPLSIVQPRDFGAQKSQLLSLFGYRSPETKKAYEQFLKMNYELGRFGSRSSEFILNISYLQDVLIAYLHNAESR